MCIRLIEILLKMQILMQKVWVGLRVYVSNKLPGGVHAAHTTDHTWNNKILED